MVINYTINANTGHMEMEDLVLESAAITTDELVNCKTDKERAELIIKKYINIDDKSPASLLSLPIEKDVENSNSMQLKDLLSEYKALTSKILDINNYFKDNGDKKTDTEATEYIFNNIYNTSYITDLGNLFVRIRTQINKDKVTPPNEAKRDFIKLIMRFKDLEKLAETLYLQSARQLAKRKREEAERFVKTVDSFADTAMKVIEYRAVEDKDLLTEKEDEVIKLKDENSKLMLERDKYKVIHDAEKVKVDAIIKSNNDRIDSLVKELVDIKAKMVKVITTDIGMQVNEDELDKVPGKSRWSGEWHEVLMKGILFGLYHILNVFLIIPLRVLKYMAVETYHGVVWLVRLPLHGIVKFTSWVTGKEQM